MRILYLDIDTLRPDHLGCYGYHRRTSPNIDALARGAIRFEDVHASDTPCLPSRTALLTGRFGIHNGVVNHGGTDADPVIDGPDRGFWSRLQIESFPTRLKRAGLRTVSVSSFAQRHSAFHWYAGFDEAYNVGKYGLETADEVFAIADDWLRRCGGGDNWFLHVHLWDPHTPYRADARFGEPFAEEPLPGWLDEAVRIAHWNGCGPHSAQECNGFAPEPTAAARYPRQPQQIASMADVRRMFDGYDTGVLAADEAVGRLIDRLDALGVYDDTAILVTSDHGETLGELNVYGDHQTADRCTTRVPMILRWPEFGAEGRGRVEPGLHYQIDVSATVLELLGQRVPARWDGRSLASSLGSGPSPGRDFLVLSQAAWTCQRAVRFGEGGCDYHCIFTYHDGYHLYPDVMLFDIGSDPHEQVDLAAQKPDLVAHATRLLEEWLSETMRDAARGRDPLLHVLQDGGPFHVRGRFAAYLDRLRATGRSQLAATLAAKHPHA